MKTAVIARITALSEAAAMMNWRCSDRVDGGVAGTGRILRLIRLADIPAGVKDVALVLRLQQLARSRWAVVAVVIVLSWLIIGSSGVASAHAILELSSPSNEATLATSPAQVSVTFSENVGLVPGSLRVFDGQGKRVDLGDQRHGAHGSIAVVDLKPRLPNGSYAVAWQVISADTHPVHGGFIFSVGAASPTANLSTLVSSKQDPGWLAIGATLRGLAYLWAFLTVGGAVFVAFAGDARDRRRSVKRAMLVGGAMSVLLTVAQLPQQAALATGLGGGSLFDKGVLGQVLDEGIIWTQIGVAVAAVMAAVVVYGVAARWRSWLAVATVAVLTGAFVVSGHTRTTRPVWLTSLADAVHVAAGAVWVGGLVFAGWSIRHRRSVYGGDDPEAAAAMIVRFSHLATLAVLAIGAAGVVLAFQLVGSISGLFLTTYGLLVLSKMTVLALIVVIASFNHFRLMPAITSKPDRAKAWRYLSRAMRAEAVGILIILGVTGVLVNQIPTRTIDSKQTVFSGTARVGSGSVNVVIQPAATGRSTMHLYLLDAQGRPDIRVQSVALQLTQKAQAIGPLDQQIFKAGPGHYQAVGTLFTVPGTWTVTVRVRVDEFTEDDANLTVEVRG